MGHRAGSMGLGARSMGQGDGSMGQKPRQHEVVRVYDGKHT